MATRVTTTMIARNLLLDLGRAQEKIQKGQEMAASGKRLLRPSDAPADVVKAMRLQAARDSIDQYRKNIVSGRNWLQATDDALRAGTDIFQRLRQLTIQAANSATPDSGRAMIAEEFEQLFFDLVDTANTRKGNQFVFAGHKTSVQPYEVEYDGGGEITGVSYQGDDGLIVREINGGVTVPVNVSGSEGFKGTEIFDLVLDVRDEILDNDLEALSGRLDEMGEAINHFLARQADAGARLNRLERAKTRLTDYNVTLRKIISELEDADIAEIVIDMKTQQVGYQAALRTGAKILQPSLVNYL